MCKNARTVHDDFHKAVHRGEGEYLWYVVVGNHCDHWDMLVVQFLDQEAPFLLYTTVVFEWVLNEFIY